jgi:very-short-patch-repair endonuclease
MPDAKSLGLLRFLQGIAALRQKPFKRYSDDDSVSLLFFGDLPSDEKHIKSPFVTPPTGATESQPWLVVQKAKVPPLPPLPATLEQWIGEERLVDPAQEPELPSEIFLAETSAPHSGAEVTTLRLGDHPDVSVAWEKYLTESWRPWAHARKQWEKLQEAYNVVDEMRRKQEDGGEGAELLLAFGLLQWNSEADSIDRHMFVAPAEITLNAARGRLTVEPAGAFDRFRIETDMLPVAEAPDIPVDEDLAALDTAAWSKDMVAPLLRKVANAWRADAQADVHEMLHKRSAGGIPWLLFAPALVMRKRRSSAYTDVLKQLLDAVDGDASAAPWDALMAEGASAGPSAASRDESPLPVSGSYNFPLPANDEQREILDLLCMNTGVLVKGPPGTGKSHTIANLICHLLSEGHRILVTAHAPKALAVLRDLLPKEMQNLCVTMMSGSREDQRLLEDSVSTILAKQQIWPSEAITKGMAADLERRLNAIRREQEIAEHNLRECREAETLVIDLPGGYSGTRATVARKVVADAERFSWFPYQAIVATKCPLTNDEVRRFALAGREFPEAIVPDLKRSLGSLRLPTPTQFVTLCRTLSETNIPQDDRGTLTAVFASHSDESLKALCERVAAIQNHAATAQHTLGALAEHIVSDLLSGRGEKWRILVAEAKSLLENLHDLAEATEGRHFHLPNLAPPEMAGLVDDIERRRAHFENGGRRGWWVFAPRVVRETATLEKTCRVNGRPVRNLEDLVALSDYLHRQGLQKRLEQIWPVSIFPEGHVREIVASCQEATVAIESLVDRVATVFEEWGPSRSNWPIGSAKSRSGWRGAAFAELHRRKVARFQELHNDLLLNVHQAMAAKDAHACLNALAQAVAEKDATAYAQALSHRERMLKKQTSFNNYLATLKKINGACPGLGLTFYANRADEAWADRAEHLIGAWSWAFARREIGKSTTPSQMEDLNDKIHRFQEQREQLTSDLVALKSWEHFFGRLDPKVRANLIAWQATMRRIGQGTGRNANMLRRQARAYLEECIPAIPVWVMPLHKLWDTVRPAPGLFDTIIVDEASQAGLDALPLLMLGKRIVVVGDDMQNSPEVVGLDTNNVLWLIDQHLGDVPFRSEFVPTSSLFDHAYRTFSARVTLREHFRCAPEIIRFSNRFYNPPLLPLRQLPAAGSRILALKTTFVAGGTSQGSDAFIRNDSEADAIVAAVQSIVSDPAYESKTIGVIAMQGRAQAQCIARKLAAVLPPDVIEERRLRCGESANFQGDQRDVVLLSLVVGPNQRYVARTTLPDQRRYNVAMSRARDQVWLFHSVRLADLSPDDLRHKLLHFFQKPDAQTDQRLDPEPLRRAAKGPRELGSAPSPFESWFELDVWLDLTDRGYIVAPQVEVAHYRIDLVVEGSSSRLAVECDGEHWHGPERYAADMARQRQLERANWTFSRVRESAFYADREATLLAVVEKCRELGIEPWTPTTDSREGEPEPMASEANKSDSGSRPDADEPFVLNGGFTGSDADESDELDDDSDDDAPEMRDEAIPFSGYCKSKAYPDPRDAAPANVRECVTEIIRQDGPLMCSSVYRLYAEACPAFRRCGKAVKAKLNQAIATLLRTGVIARESEVDGLPDESRVLRLTDTPRWRVRPAGKRDILEIPPLELMAVLDERRFRHDEPNAVSDRDFATVLLQHYEGQRMTRARETYLSAVVHAWKMRQSVLDSASGG